MENNTKDRPSGPPDGAKGTMPPEMAKKFKKISLQMSLLMGLTLSLCLSFVGGLTGAKQSGKFSVPGFLLSFVVSFLISLLIGFLVPMKKVSDSATKNMKPGIGKRCVESLISDLIYTPFITLAMVFMNWKMATSHGAKIPFPPMLAKSMIISLLVAYVLIFIFMPLFMKMLFKKNGIPMGGNMGKPGSGK